MDTSGHQWALGTIDPWWQSLTGTGYQWPLEVSGQWKSPAVTSWQWALLSTGAGMGTSGHHQASQQAMGSSGHHRAVGRGHQWTPLGTRYFYQAPLGTSGQHWAAGSTAPLGTTHHWAAPGSGHHWALGTTGQFFNFDFSMFRE